jgi:hypothetical protein
MRGMKPTESAREEARRYPGGHVYAIDGVYGPNDAVPPEAIAGAWKVDDKGEIVGEFIPNPNHRPKGTGRGRLREFIHRILNSWTERN